MSEKKLPKAKLERAIDLVKAYFDPTDWELSHSKLNDMHEACCALESKADLGSFVLLDFISCIVRYSGMNRGATNEDIYKVLEVLGWQVVDDESAEHRTVDE